MCVLYGDMQTCIYIYIYIYIYMCMYICVCMYVGILAIIIRPVTKSYRCFASIAVLKKPTKRVCNYTFSLRPEH